MSYQRKPRQNNHGGNPGAAYEHVPGSGGVGCLREGRHRERVQGGADCGGGQVRAVGRGEGLKRGEKDPKTNFLVRTF